MLPGIRVSGVVNAVDPSQFASERVFFAIYCEALLMEPLRNYHKYVDLRVGRPKLHQPS
jgi:hypothetical protein